jgi:hypothetical protein
VRISLTSVHRSNLFQLFRSYLLSFPNDREFAQALDEEVTGVLPGLESAREKVSLFDLALCLPGRSPIMRYARGLIAPAPAVADPTVERAVLYVREFFDAAELQAAAAFLFAMATAPAAPTLLYRAARLLAGAVVERLAAPRPFVRFLQHCIGYAWNRKGSRCPIAKRAFLLDLADFLGPHPSFDGWALFLGTVVRHYHRRAPFPVDFEIPEAAMDPALLRPFLSGDEQAGAALADLQPRSARRSSLGSEPPSSGRGAPVRQRRDSFSERSRTEACFERVPLEPEPEDTQTVAVRRGHRKRDKKKKCAIA